MKFLLLILTMLIILLLSILTLMLNLISKKTFMDREKNSPFECGFDPKTSSRTPFSIHFFLIAIIFIIFDVELTILLPMVLTMKMSNLLNFSFIFLFFSMILIFGIIHEWKQGALTWTK